MEIWWFSRNNTNYLIYLEFSNLLIMNAFLVSHRDVAKNALLRWRAFIYWTFLGVFDALVFFFGAYLLLDNTVVTSNGQVSVGFHQSMVIFLNANCEMNLVLFSSIFHAR